MKKQTKNQLSFLDVLFTSNGDSNCLYTNYLPFEFLSYKIGPVKTLFHRVSFISSNWSTFHFSKTKELLQYNLYPSNFIDQQIKQYLHPQVNDKQKQLSNSTYATDFESIYNLN